jgi:Uma2 family endonuclease
MTTLLEHPQVVCLAEEVLPLENGDRRDQPTFHRRYEAMPSHVRAELIGGLVYTASPVGKVHARPKAKAIVWLDAYESVTPGVETYKNATVILGPDSEVQPDVCLLIAGSLGQTQEVDDYISGAPELVVEIASSSQARDLHIKLHDYERAGVLEYVVLLPRKREVRWFQNSAGEFQQVNADPDGIYRSRVFPGLWLEPAALFRGDSRAVRAVVEQGVSTPEHAEFVRRLAEARPEG